MRKHNDSTLRGKRSFPFRGNFYMSLIICLCYITSSHAESIQTHHCLWYGLQQKIIFIFDRFPSRWLTLGMHDTQLRLICFLCLTDCMVLSQYTIITIWRICIEKWLIRTVYWIIWTNVSKFVTLIQLEISMNLIHSKRHIRKSLCILLV